MQLRVLPIGHLHSDERFLRRWLDRRWLWLRLCGVPRRPDMPSVQLQLLPDRHSRHDVQDGRRLSRYRRPMSALLGWQRRLSERQLPERDLRGQLLDLPLTACHDPAQLTLTKPLVSAQVQKLLWLIPTGTQPKAALDAGGA